MPSTTVLILGLVVVAALVAIVPHLVGDDDGHPLRAGHAEIVPAAAALTYATFAQLGDARSLCYATAGKAARTMGCGTSHPRVESCGRVDENATRVLEFGELHAQIHVGTCTISLTGPDWVVTDVVRD